MTTFESLRLPINDVVILTKRGHEINVGKVFLEKVEYGRDGRERRIYTIDERAIEDAYQRLQAYKKQQSIAPSWERSRYR